MATRWGRFYWGRKGEGERMAEGVVVLFSWLSSQEKHLKPYVDLYWSLGWGALVCHVDFLTLFFPEKATKLAYGVLNELIKELKVRPLPIVLASFSGGSKGCLYKVLQVIDGKCKGKHSQSDYQLVRDCLSGQLYDSSPTDFNSTLGTRFVLHPSVLKLSHPPRVVAWMAKAFASGLDALFINRFEAERAEYWQTLYSSANAGPFLILCSEDDEMAPYEIICGFAKRLQELGGDVNLVKWSNSAHVAHYRHHRDEYATAVAELLAKASRNFSMRWPARDPNPSSVNPGGHQKWASLSPVDHLPTSSELPDTACGSLADEHAGVPFELPSSEPTGPHPSSEPVGPQNPILCDVCVPSSSLHCGHVFSSAGRQGLLPPVKCIKGSRL